MGKINEINKQETCVFDSPSFNQHMKFDPIFGCHKL